MINLFVLDFFVGTLKHGGVNVSSGGFFNGISGSASHGSPSIGGARFTDISWPFRHPTNNSSQLTAPSDHAILMLTIQEVNLLVDKRPLHCFHQHIQCCIAFHQKANNPTMLAQCIYYVDNR